MKLLEDYLGDGIYVSYDGDSLALDLRDQPPTPTNRIVVEKRQFESLLHFCKTMTERFHKLNPEISKDRLWDPSPLIKDF